MRKTEDAHSAERIYKLAYNILDDTKAQDITILDVSKRRHFADFIAIATCTSSRHCDAMSDKITQAFREIGVFTSVEGKGSGEWLLIDAEDVVINIFTAEGREKFHLESLWTGCPSIALGN